MIPKERITMHSSINWSIVINFSSSSVCLICGSGIIYNHTPKVKSNAIENNLNSGIADYNNDAKCNFYKNKQ